MESMESKGRSKLQQSKTSLAADHLLSHPSFHSFLFVMLDSLVYVALSSILFALLTLPLCLQPFLPLDRRFLFDLHFALLGLLDQLLVVLHLEALRLEKRLFPGVLLAGTQNHFGFLRVHALDLLVRVVVQVVEFKIQFACPGGEKEG